MARVVPGLGEPTSARLILGRDNGKENGNYYNGLCRGQIGVISGLNKDNGKYKGNYDLGYYQCVSLSL